MAHWGGGCCAKKSGYQPLERRTYSGVFFFVKCGYGREEQAEFVFRITLRLSPLGMNEELLHNCNRNVLSSVTH